MGDAGPLGIGLDILHGGNLWPKSANVPHCNASTGYAMAITADDVTKLTRMPLVKTDTKKPKGWKAFDALARKLVKVPKTEVERVESARKKRKKRGK